jgi:hypothetical protein
MPKFSKVGDLKKYLKDISDDLPLFINARESFSCNCMGNCYCSQEYDEYEISSIYFAKEEAKKEYKTFWERGSRAKPDRIVITLAD